MRHHDRIIFLIVKKNAAQKKISKCYVCLRQSMTDVVRVVHEEVYSIVHPSIRIHK